MLLFVFLFSYLSTIVLLVLVLQGDHFNDRAPSVVCRLWLLFWLLVSFRWVWFGFVSVLMAYPIRRAWLIAGLWLIPPKRIEVFDDGFGARRRGCGVINTGKVGVVLPLLIHVKIGGRCGSQEPHCISIHMKR